MGQEDNKKKALSGIAVKKLLGKTLENLSSNPHLKITYQMNYDTGYEGYVKNQFKMDALIKFHNSDDEIWLIKTTSSIRSDRVKGNHFDAQNIRKINPKLKRIYLVTSDFADPKETYNTKQYSGDMSNHNMCSEISDIISFNTLRWLIRDKAVENLSQGVRANVLSKATEETIMRSLNNADIIELWIGILKSDLSVKS